MAGARKRQVIDGAIGKICEKYGVGRGKDSADVRRDIRNGCLRTARGERFHGEPKWLANASDDHEMHRFAWMRRIIDHNAPRIAKTVRNDGVDASRRWIRQAE